MVDCPDPTLWALLAAMAALRKHLNIWLFMGMCASAIIIIVLRSRTTLSLHIPNTHASQRRDGFILDINTYDPARVMSTKTEGTPKEESVETDETAREKSAETDGRVRARSTETDATVREKSAETDGRVRAKSADTDETVNVKSAEIDRAIKAKSIETNGTVKAKSSETDGSVKAKSTEKEKLFRVKPAETDRPVKVFVMVTSTHKNVEQRQSVRKTWGKKVKMKFIISKQSNQITNEEDLVELPVPEGRGHLTEKTMEGFRYVYEHHLNDADWFMKADDDTYVIVENLRHFLSKLNSSEPLHLGHHFYTLLKQGYHSGGAGYVLSKRALILLYRDLTHPWPRCITLTHVEDLEMGRCMAVLNVTIKETVDSQGRMRFNCFIPEYLLFGPLPDWYHYYHKAVGGSGHKSISSSAITFHYMNPAKMYTLDFYLYNLTVYGEWNGH